MAIKVQRSMLNKDNYEWKAKEGDNPKKTQHDAVMFSRREGYEVVRMIQKIVDHFGYESESDVSRIADVIATDLPGDVRSQANVKAWLIEYFSTH